MCRKVASGLNHDATSFPGSLILPGTGGGKMKDPGNEVVSNTGLLLLLRFVKNCSKVISKSHNRVITLAIEVILT